jgi:uncharacterized protein (TIGR03084 family)
MMQQAIDMQAEAADLDRLLSTLTPEQWNATTKFKQWTVWDIVAHLHFFDLQAVYSATNLAKFGFEALKMTPILMGKGNFRDYTRKKLAHLDGAKLHTAWKETCNEMCEKIGELDPVKPLKWYGPPMKAGTFINARQMETWAHSQAIYDLIGVQRDQSEIIKNIVEMGIRTYKWTFVNRKQEIPGDAPKVTLSAPSGAIWEYKPDSTNGHIQGSAFEFCQVVTQTRHIADTKLVVEGDAATQWMELAQCFAGAPNDPPAPGSRG